MSAMNRALAIVAGIFLVAGGNAPAAPPLKKSASPAEFNVLPIGHSLIVNLSNVELLARRVGHLGYKCMLYAIPGSSIAYHYQAPWIDWRKIYFSPDEKWDALILSARDADWRGREIHGSDEDCARSSPPWPSRTIRNARSSFMATGLGFSTNLTRPRSTMRRMSLFRVHRRVPRTHRRWRGQGVPQARRKTRIMPVLHPDTGVATHGRPRRIARRAQSFCAFFR